MHSLIVFSLLAVSGHAFLFGNLFGGGGCSPCGGGAPMFPAPAPSYGGYPQQSYQPQYQQQGYAQPQQSYQPQYQPQQSYAQPQPQYQPQPQFQPQYQPQQSYSAPVSQGYATGPSNYQPQPHYNAQPQHFQPEATHIQTYTQPQARQPQVFQQTTYHNTGYQGLSWADMTRNAPIVYRGYPNPLYRSGTSPVAPVSRQPAPLVHVEQGYIQPSAPVQPAVHKAVVVEKTEVIEPEVATFEREPVVVPQTRTTYTQPAAPAPVVTVVQEKHIAAPAPSYNAISTPEEAGY